MSRISLHFCPAEGLVSERERERERDLPNKLTTTNIANEYNGGLPA